MGKLSQAMDIVEATSTKNESPSQALDQSYEPGGESQTTTSAENLRTEDRTTTKSLPPESADTSKWDERLIKATERLSAVAENIRKLRTSIMHPEDGVPIRSIMITSSAPAEGKSFICANLAVSIAKSIERHAMMLDCDLRRPTLQKLFGIDSDKGLSDYLLGKDTIPNLIQQTGLHKLSIIPSGKPPENPAELLSAVRMSALLDEMAMRYNDRLILLDTAPFHSASETRVLSQSVDKVILVVRWGKSSLREVKKATDLIGSEKIIGIVFNAVETNILDRKVQGLSYQDYYTNRYY